LRIEFDLPLNNSKDSFRTSVAETRENFAQELYVVVRLPLYQPGDPPDLENPPGDR